MSTTKQRKRLTDAEFPIPKAIPRNELCDLLEAHDFTSTETIALAARLDEIIFEYSSHMNKTRRRKSASDDKKNLKDSIKKINDAVWHLKSCGPVGRQIAQYGTSSLGEMLNVSWLREKFPDEDGLPARAFPSRDGRHMRSEVRHRLREEPVYIEEHTREARFYFAREHNLSLVGAVLSEINSSLDEALQKSKGPGGRDRCEFRHYFLINLALAWKQAGRDPHKSGSFLAFCEHVFDYIGWPPAGIKRAIDKALVHSGTGL
jgi:hypothetical protein